MAGFGFVGEPSDLLVGNENAARSRGLLSLSVIARPKAGAPNYAVRRRASA